MKIEVERSPDLKGLTPWVKVKFVDHNGFSFHRYAIMVGNGPYVVNWFTPKGVYYREKAFDDHEEAWRFMWRKATETKG